MLKYLLEKEIKQIFRNPFLPKIIFIMPVVLLLILPWAANQEVKNIHLSIIDNDRSATSRQLTEKILASGYFQLAALAANNEEALQGIESGASDLVLEIASGLENQWANPTPDAAAPVQISANAVNSMKGGLGAYYLATILDDYAADRRQETGIEFPPPIRLSVNYRYNPHLDYKAFMVPAILVILLTILSGFLPALNIVGEKETGAIEQINVTPVSRFTFILAKLIPYWIIGFVILTLGLGIAAGVYRLGIAGRLIDIYLYAGIYILGVSGLGLVISNYSDTLQQAMFTIFFFIMILIMMSGLFTPVESMPEWAQLLSKADPLTYFMRVMRSICLKGSRITDLLPQLAALLAFALLFNTWAVISYRKTNRN